jgi:hypothetical protein
VSSTSETIETRDDFAEAFQCRGIARRGVDRSIRFHEPNLAFMLGPVAPVRCTAS